MVSKSKTTPTLWPLALPGAMVLGLFFILPLGAVVREGLDGAAFGRLLGDPAFWSGLWATLALSAASAVVALGVGACVALHLARLKPATRSLISFVISLPLTFSGLIVAYGFILCFGRAGFVTLLLAELGFDPVTLSSALYGPVGLTLAYTYYLTPRVVLLLLPVLVNFDWSQVTAAESLGAGRRAALFDVLVPQIAPTAIAALVLVAAVALGAYGTALALVGTQINILPLQLYSKIADAGNDFPAAAALSLVLLGLAASLIAVAEVNATRKERASAH